MRSRHSGGVRSVQRRRPDDEILAVVSHHLQERIIGLEDLALAHRNADPDDVGVDQAPDLRLAFREIAVQTGILQRDRRLRGEQLQHGDPGRREDAGGQVVFQVEHADELGLGDQGQAENGAGVMLGM